MLFGSHPKKCQVVSRLQVSQSASCLFTQPCDKGSILHSCYIVKRGFDGRSFRRGDYYSDDPFLVFQFLEYLFHFRLERRKVENSLILHSFTDMTMPPHYERAHEYTTRPHTSYPSVTLVHPDFHYMC